MKFYSRFFVLAFFYALTSCNSRKENKTVEEKPVRNVTVPAFNADSAYSYVSRQVAFGPRVPNTRSHKNAGDYFIETFSKAGATVVQQNFEATTFDHQTLELRNIIASFSPEKKKRILLAAHWDTRPFADKDPANKNAAFDGANDGASGVGILLEMARLMGSNTPPDVGVDFILFDGEDWGERNDAVHTEPLRDELKSWWCLGSQYWAKHKHKSDYTAYYGILLDMVGAHRSHFYREGLSLEFAPKIVDNVWSVAARLGYSDYFVKQNVGEITDDHQFINRIAKIPTVDIVDYKPGIGFFGDYHHSTKDNLELISKETLHAVGTTLMNVIYFEEPL